jgi:hypothetical protein
MARLYLWEPKIIYDRATMPLVKGHDLTNGCTFVRFHWVPTEWEQEAIDGHWRPDFYRHSLINTKMSLATGAGVGVPGWDPFYGMSEAEKEALEGDEYFRVADKSLGTKIARGQRIRPTGLATDPRLPPRDSEPRTDIVQILRDAAARYDVGVAAEHQRLLAEHAALKKGTWAQRAAAPKTPPTLEDARRAYELKVGGRKEERPWWAPEPAVVPGVWHEWEIVEVERERARQARVEAAWERAEAAVKRVLGEKWGGGT